MVDCVRSQILKQELTELKLVQMEHFLLAVSAIKKRNLHLAKYIQIWETELA